MAQVSIDVWNGRLIRTLRDAKRLTQQEFAAKIGVSERMVAKWEGGGENTVPRPVNQSALDTFLDISTEAEKDRFARSVGSVSDHAAPSASAQAAEAEDAVIDLDRLVRHPLDGKLMVRIDEGTFIGGSSNDVPIWLPEFYIDVYPTTNADYARFLAAAGHPAPYEWDVAAAAGDLAHHPVIFVTWHDAAAYAEWARKSLPSSHQWEKAARGVRGELYPWGSRLTPAKCNVRESGIRATTPVDRYQSGVSPYGVYDLCGNTWEWCQDETNDGRHELKGSAFTSPFMRCTPSNFNDAAPEMCDDDTGFRCVSTREQFDPIRP